MFNKVVIQPPSRPFAPQAARAETATACAPLSDRVGPPGAGDGTGDAAGLVRLAGRERAALPAHPGHPGRLPGPGTPGGRARGPAAPGQVPSAGPGLPKGAQVQGRLGRGL